MTTYRAQDFVNSIGVNTHTPYTDTTYVNAAKVLKCLDYIGVRHVRDWAYVAPGAQGEWNYPVLLTAGLKFCYTFPTSDIPGVIARISAAEAKYPGTTAAIEGPNEIGNNNPVSYNGLTGEPAGQAFQAAIYTAVKADPRLASVPVINLNDRALAPGAADMANFHPYARDGGQPFALLQQINRHPTLPNVITETGYHTVPKGGKVSWPQVDFDTQAAYTVNGLLGGFLLGIRRTYLYELLDEKLDNMDENQRFQFGLFNVLHQPKPAATALRAMTLALSDPSPAATTFTPVDVPVEVTGLPATGHVLQLQKASGETFVIVWNEPKIWDHATYTRVVPPAVSVTVKSGGTSTPISLVDTPVVLRYSITAAAQLESVGGF